jgi:predicted transcriptional regulator
MSALPDSIKRIPSTQIQEVAKALAGDLRLRILEVLGDRTMSLSQLMIELEVAQPTISINIQILEQAGLVVTAVGSNREKMCSRAHHSLLIELPNRLGDALPDMEEVRMPVGMYTDCSIGAPCGLAGKDGLIGCPDDPRTFYLPERSEAQLLWFSDAGFVEYRFPNPVPPGVELTELRVSAEICSEALGFNSEWPSDINCM